VPGAVTVIVIDADAPGASVARVHVTVVVPEQLQPVPVAETRLVPAGSGSETLTEFAVTVDELFVTVTVYVRVPFVWTGSGESVFVIERSAIPTVDVAVDVLFAGVLSFEDETVAVLEIVPGDAG
jgi:hypothetical protein